MKSKIIMVALAVVVVVSLVIVGCEKAAPAPTPTPTPTPAPEAEVIKWIGQCSTPTGMPAAEGTEELSKRIAIASGGRLVLDYKPAGSVVPAYEEWTGIDKGVLDFAIEGMGDTLPEVPFGGIVNQRCGARLPALGHMIWYETGGRDLVNKWFKELGYNVMLVGSLHGLAEGWIHTDKPLTGPEDLAGLKMRAAGDGGAILARMGVGTVFMPLGEIFENMERGVIDAYECSNPAFDWDMGLYEAGKYYYLGETRAAWEPFELMVSPDKWNELPDDLKVLVKDCITAQGVYYNARLVAKNEVAIQNFKDYGVIVEQIPTSISEAFVKEAKAYYNEQASKHPATAEILQSELEFEEMWAELYGLPA